MARKAKEATKKVNGGIKELMKELWEAAVQLRGNIEPSDYKRYVLPIIFLRFLSLRYETRSARQPSRRRLDLKARLGALPIRERVGLGSPGTLNVKVHLS